MLNIVRCSGLRRVAPAVHCYPALAAAITIVACGRCSSSVANTNANDSDMVAPAATPGSADTNEERQSPP